MTRPSLILLLLVLLVAGAGGVRLLCPAPDGVVRSEVRPERPRRTGSVGPSLPPARAALPDLGPALERISPPAEIVAFLGLGAETAALALERHRDDAVHREWTERIQQALPDLDGVRLDMIAEDHATWLELKVALDRAYMRGEVDRGTFAALAEELMRWHQRSVESVLSDAEYRAVFARAPREVEEAIERTIADLPAYSFVPDRGRTEELARIDADGLARLDGEFRRAVLVHDEADRRLRAGELSAEEAEEVRDGARHVFVAAVRGVLTPEEIDAVFGSFNDLEHGVSYSLDAALSRSVCNGLLPLQVS